MTETDQLRIDLSRLPPSEEFTSEDFNMYSQISGTLFKMERRGEVLHTRWRDRGGTTKPVKVYKVGVLKFPVPKTLRQSTASNKKHIPDPRTEPWKAVYPDLFEVYPPPVSMRTITFKENSDLE